MGHREKRTRILSACQLDLIDLFLGFCTNVALHMGKQTDKWAGSYGHADSQMQTEKNSQI